MITLILNSLKNTLLLLYLDFHSTLKNKELKLFNDQPIQDVTLSTLTGAATGAAVGLLIPGMLVVVVVAVVFFCFFLHQILAQPGFEPTTSLEFRLLGHCCCCCCCCKKINKLINILFSGPRLLNMVSAGSCVGFIGKMFF